MSWPHSAILDGVSDHQREHYDLASAGRIGLISGGPGTGKTRLASALIKAIRKQALVVRELSGGSEFSSESPRESIKGLWTWMAMPINANPVDGTIAVCAPTGKAATRITEVMRADGIDIQATTIHTLLSINRTGYDGEGWTFHHNENEPLPFEHVIVDEPSMIDSDLMASLLKAIKPGTHVMFLGDPYQLPPVGHGRPFQDMIDAGLPHGHLTEIWRFSGRIAHVCDAIKNGRAWSGSGKVDIDAESPENLRLIEVANPSLGINQMLEMVQRLVGASEGHPLLRGLDPINDIQVICTVKDKSTYSVKNVNKVLQSCLNPPRGRKDVGGFYEGDKVICTRNQWREEVDDLGFDVGTNKISGLSKQGRKAWDKAAMPKFERYVANGEIGQVLRAEKSKLLIRFGSHTIVFGPELSDISLAYAITGHKSQGSQWPVTIPLIDDYIGAARIANRNYWYTVLSRASRLCIPIGRELVLRAHCRAQPLSKRKTFLREDIEAWRNQPQTSNSGSALGSS